MEDPIEEILAVFTCEVGPWNSQQVPVPQAYSWYKLVELVLKLLLELLRWLLYHCKFII